MKKQWPREMVLVLLGVMTVVCLYLAIDQGVTRKGEGLSQETQASTSARDEVVVLDSGRVIPVEVVDSDSARARGLSGRAMLAPETGMLFHFDDEGIYPFWMKDMKFPIDIVWIRNGTVVDITENMQPPVVGQDIPSYVPRVSADAVLELNAGEAQKFGIKIGSLLSMRM